MNCKSPIQDLLQILFKKLNLAGVALSNALVYLVYRIMVISIDTNINTFCTL